MYTRSYFSEDEAVRLPEKYDGTVFKENAEALSEPECKISEETVGTAVGEKSEESVFSRLFERLPFGSLFKKGKGAFPIKLDKCRIESFGTEELLIIAIALYLFFSKDGDKECAIMLAILVFI